MQPKLVVAGASVTVMLFVAGCGGTTQPAAGASPSPSPTPSKATIAVATNASLGPILVDAAGMTVYMFAADTGTVSKCDADCAGFWPPVLTVGTPTAGTGAQARLLGTAKRSDGNVQVTYAGHPLYKYWADRQAGETHGQGLNGFGGLWWVLSPSGAAIH